MFIIQVYPISYFPEPSGDKKKFHMNYDISLKEDVEMKNFLEEFSRIDGIAEVVLVSSKNDITY